MVWFFPTLTESQSQQSNMATTLVARSPSPHRNAGNPPREPESPPPLLAALASLSMSASPVPVSSSPDSVKQWKIPTMPPMQRIAVPIIVPPPPTAGSPPIISVPQQPPLSPMQMTEAHTQSSLEEEHLPRHGHRHRHKHTHPSSDKYKLFNFGDLLLMLLALCQFL